LLSSCVIPGNIISIITTSFGNTYPIPVISGEAGKTNKNFFIWRIDCFYRLTVCDKSGLEKFINRLIMISLASDCFIADVLVAFELKKKL